MTKLTKKQADTLALAELVMFVACNILSSREITHLLHRMEKLSSKELKSFGGVCLLNHTIRQENFSRGNLKLFWKIIHSATFPKRDLKGYYQKIASNKLLTTTMFNTIFGSGNNVTDRILLAKHPNIAPIKKAIVGQTDSMLFKALALNPAVPLSMLENIKVYKFRDADLSRFLETQEQQTICKQLQPTFRGTFKELITTIETF